MLTITSLAAQSQFGTLIDSSQSQPVAVTRHGRPDAVVQSYADYVASTKTIPFHVAALIAESYPLRGEGAGQAMRAHLAKLTDNAAKSGLTEEQVKTMLDDDAGT